MPPPPHLSLFLLMQVLAVPFLLSLSGAFALRRAMGRKVHAVVGCIAVVVALFFGFGDRGAAVTVTLLVGVYSLACGMQTAWQGLRGPQGEVAHPEQVPSRSRLLYGGFALMTIAAIGSSGALALARWWPETGPVEADLRRFVATQLALGQEAAIEGGSPTYAPLDHPSDRSASLRGVPFGALLLRRPDRTDIRDQHTLAFELTDEGRGFRVHVMPFRMPFAPFNRLVSHPSFHADETGKIRRVEVHDIGLQCPPDGPVWAEVSEEEIAAAARALIGAAGRPAEEEEE